MSDELTITAEELGLEPGTDVVIDGPPAAAPKEIKPEEGIEELRAKLLVEQAARERVEALATQATSAAHYAFSEKEQSDIALVQSALQQVERDSRDMKAAYSAALKAGNTDKCADLAMDMQAMSASRQQLEQGLEALKERAQAARQPAPQPQPRAMDPVEAVASRLSPASARWVRSHPEFATDDSKRNKMVAAHYEAVAEGIASDSREYFDFIEQKLGVENAPEPRQTTSRPSPRPQPPAAPARGNSGADNRRVVTLSAAEREIAKMNGMTDEEYAKNKMTLQAEGKIGKAN